jgi:hypothetical protein
VLGTAGPDRSVLASCVVERYVADFMIIINSVTMGVRDIVVQIYDTKAIGGHMRELILWRLRHFSCVIDRHPLSTDLW